MLRRVGVAALVLAVAAGCQIPSSRGDVEVGSSAVTEADVNRIYDRYTEVRNAAISVLNAQPMSIVERGPVLDIDAGSFEVAKRLSLTRAEVPRVTVREIFSPHFTKYPLWFVTVIDDAEAGQRKVQVFERESAVDPWLLVESPEIDASATLPDLRMKNGSVVTVEPDNGTGMGAAAEDAATAYARALGDPKSDEVEVDAFLKQMRETARRNSELENIRFSQQWRAEDVKFVLRTADGGALAFVDLVREDTYEVPAGLTVTWPEGSPQKAFLADGITGSGKLSYAHQVLLQIPAGSGKPRAIGQFGGVTGTDLEGAAGPGGSSAAGLSDNSSEDPAAE